MIETTMNEAGNGGGSITMALPEVTRRELLALRRKYDADTPIGRGCSNIDEQIQNNAPPALIEWQMARLRRLLTAAQGGRRM